jgi:hypothetical protein
MARSPRAYWKGFLRLCLVSIPVHLHNAVESKSEISFRQIHKPSGRRVNYEKVVQGIGKIENADIVKGYEVDADTYVLLDPEEIDAIKLESKRTIDLVQFVDAKQVDYRYFERPYFLVPADEMAGEGYAVISRCLAQDRKGRACATHHPRSGMVGRGGSSGRWPHDGRSATLINQPCRKCLKLRSFVKTPALVLLVSSATFIVGAAGAS